MKCLTGSALDVAKPEVLPATALSPDGPGTIHPCKSKTPGWEAASKAVDALAAHVSNLADDGDPKAVKAELDALLATDCFALAAADLEDASVFDSAVSLKAWWDDGGDAWVRHYLALDESRQSLVPPTRRRALTTASPKAKGHPLAPLLCPPADARSTDAIGCAHETVGWVKRADASLIRRAAHGLLGTSPRTPEGCIAEALSKEVSAEDRYARYRACIDTVTLHRDALPLGRFKAPTDGWFVTAAGRRTSCTELRAYDLATGTAYRVSDCSGRRRAATAGPSTEIGRVPLPLLREAVWMILLSQVSEHQVVTEGRSFQVPEEIAIGRPARSGGHGSSVGFGCGSSAPRSWSWMRDKGGALVGQASGIIQAPTGCDDADGHAAELLEVAEDGFEAGCAPAGAPSRLPWSAPGPAVEHDHAALLDEAFLEPARAELAKVAATRRVPCPNQRP